jgi:Patatin-like phospholipase
MTTFKEIQNKERDTIKAGRGDTEPAKSLFGLAFSGGGIRSATFNLGVLQALAEAKLLKRIDYLSTVSGGGYIGAWFSALLQRKAQANANTNTPSEPPKNAEIKAAHVSSALDQLHDELAPNAKSSPAATPSTSASTVTPPDGTRGLLWLRRYSAFLTPRYGLLGLDTLAALAGLFRNLLLNQSILICMLMLMLLVPLGLMAAGRVAVQHLMQHGSSAHLIGALLFVLLFTAVWNIRRGLAIRDHQIKESTVWIIAGTAFAGSIFAALLFYFAPHPAHYNIRYPLILLICASCFAGFVFDWKRLHWTTLTTACLALMLYGYSLLLGLIATEFPSMLGAFSLVFGPALLVQILCMAAIVHTGLVGRGFSEINREWLGRAGGIVFALELIWVVITALSLFAGALLNYLNEWLAYSGGVAWLLGLIATVWLANSGKTGDNQSNPWLEKILRVAPYLVIVGLLVLLSSGLHKGLNLTANIPSTARVTTAQHDFTIHIKDNQFQKFEAASPDDQPTLYRSAQQSLQESAQVNVCWLMSAFAAFLGIGGLLAWRVDINLFSMHQFYRNRLTRGYLGASNGSRQPNPFTDFCKDDDLALSELAAQRPVHLVNTTLNLTQLSDEDLSWQHRRGVAFLMSPHYCGYQLSEGTQHYVATHDYMKNKNDPSHQNGILLGTAIAVSGAAASPNMGYHSSPPLAFLMTFFNVRLGRWCPNPAQSKHIQAASPSLGLRYLLSELLGQSNAQSAFVNLTDGGHFENLGIYELVRRKCKLILVSDAGEDGGEAFTFEDLGNAIQKCRIDFGVEIEMTGQDKMHPKASKSRYALGRIRYADGALGTLIYLKPQLTGQEPVDIAHYAATHPNFPHESTGDQWFEEPQFESYRQLGLITAQDMLRELDIQDSQPNECCDAFVQRLQSRLQAKFHQVSAH